MDSNKIINFIENSFLKDLIIDRNVTDISYNGKDIFYVNNMTGRNKSNIQINQDQAKDFIRQIANISEQQFSFTEPYLDVCVSKYRVNATHPCIGRLNGDNVLTFSIRIFGDELRITNNNLFMSYELDNLLEYLIEKRQSIVISGVTGSGKSELQKYLITKMKDNVRCIVIDNIQEMSNITFKNTLDITTWESNDARNPSSTSLLIKNALRNNPDWLIIAEARGGEMNDVLMSVMTGHPIITTIHSLSNETVPNRMARMALLGNPNLNYVDTINDINSHFHFLIHVNKEIKPEGINRYISSVSEIYEDGSIHDIYLKDGNKIKYKKISQNYLNLLQISNKSKCYQAFCKGGI